MGRTFIAAVVVVFLCFSFSSLVDEWQLGVVVLRLQSELTESCRALFYFIVSFFFWNGEKQFFECGTIYVCMYLELLGVVWCILPL